MDYRQVDGIVAKGLILKWWCTLTAATVTFTNCDRVARRLYIDRLKNYIMIADSPDECALGRFLNPNLGAAPKRFFRRTFMPTIFSKIIDGDIPADIVYKDEQVTAFRDIDPKAPVHILIVPNKEIPTVNDIREADEQLIGHMFTAARRIAEKEGVTEKGYRLLVNCNRDGGQEVFHLHMHLFAGRPLGPMLVKR